MTTVAKPFPLISLVLLFVAAARPACASPWTLGKKTLLYIRVDFQDLPGDPIPDKDLAKILRQFDQYIAQNSYGSCLFTSTFTPTVRLPQMAAWYVASKDQEQIIRDARAAAKAVGFDTDRYDLDLVAYDTPGGGGSGVGAIGGKGARLLNNFRLGITIHELGHNLGLPHSQFWRSSDGTILGPGQAEEYGDPCDPMGGGGGQDESMFHHYEVRSKAILGWLGNNGIVNVKTSGVYRIFAQDMPGNAMPRGLMIQRDPKTQYWIEYRQLMPENPYVSNGARILRCFPAANQIQLLDMTPDSPAGANDAALVVGRTFSDDQAAIHITPIAKNNTDPISLDISVVFGTFPRTKPPVIELTANASSVDPGEPITFRAASRDPEHNLLFYAWDFGDGTFDWGKPWVKHVWKETDRDYLVRCSVTDMRGGYADRIMLITIGRPATCHLVGTVAALNGAPVQGAHVEVFPTNSTRTDSGGNFALVGLRPGDYTVSARKVDGKFRPQPVACPTTGPIAIQSVLPLPFHDGPSHNHRAIKLHIHANIDGTDELRITPTSAHWTHGGWSWPTNISLNGVAMDPHVDLPNTGSSAFLSPDADLDSAVIVAKKARGVIDFYLDRGTLVVTFDDPAPGSDDYDADIEFQPNSAHPPRATQIITSRSQ
jgi:hypothetical protein